MAANPNYKCRFLKCELDNNSGRTVAFMLPGQTYKDGGQELPFDPSVMVVFTDFAVGNACLENEVYAAAQIEFMKQHNHYTVKGAIYKVVDEDGIMIMDGGGNADHEAAIQIWDKFSTSGGKFSASSPAPGSAPKPRVLTELEKIKADKRFAPPSIQQDGFWVSDDLWYDLVLCARNHVNVLLLGPKGTGKTELTELVASKLGYDFEGFDMSIQNPYAYLCGNTRLNAHGETVFQYARFAKRIQNSKPAVILLDELSRCAPHASNILLPVLDRRRTLYVENAIDENGLILPVGEKTTFFATANMGAEYLGVAGLDEALFDRFIVMETQYPPKNIESKVLQVRAGLDKYQADKLASFAEQVRKHKDITTKISTRKVLEVGRWVSWGYSIPEAVNRVAMSIWPTSEVDDGERTAVKAILQILN
jgi:MoxR-like ATPase